MNQGDQPNTPGPSLWPVGFAVGVACLLIGLVVSPLLIAPIGAAIAIVFAGLWVRDASGGYRSGAGHVEPERRKLRPTETNAPIPANEGEDAMPKPRSEADIDRFPRSKFLEGATLGLGGVIGGLVTVPALGFMVAPAFVGQHEKNVDLGPLSDYPEGQYVLATFFTDPSVGEVSRRTAYVRNNGLKNGEPSFTIISNRCAHLGCPVQPNGPVTDSQKKEYKSPNGGQVTIIPTQPAGFGCPCHGGQYDTEGNRTAGPPVRSLDRYEFSIRKGNLVLGKTFSVGHVDGKGADARIKKYTLTGPGEHVDGIESWMYPLQPPH